VFYLVACGEDYGSCVELHDHDRFAEELALVFKIDDPAAIYSDYVRRVASTHDCYKTGDPGVPSSIIDLNGDVVLSLCKRCRKGESELSGPCDALNPIPLPARSNT